MKLFVAWIHILKEAVTLEGVREFWNTGHGKEVQYNGMLSLKLTEP